MSAQLLFQNISEYLFVSSEWVKQWVYMPVKSKYHTYNPLMLLELIGEILKHTNSLDMDYLYRISHTWTKEVHFELRARQPLLKAKYEDLKKKYREARDKWEADMSAGGDFRESYKKMDNLGIERRNTFLKQVEVEMMLKSLGLITEDELKEIDFHTQLYVNGFEPEDVPLDSELDPNYWDDEDPDA